MIQQETNNKHYNWSKTTQLESTPQVIETKTQGSIEFDLQKLTQHIFQFENFVSQCSNS